MKFYVSGVAKCWVVKSFVRCKIAEVVRLKVSGVTRSVVKCKIAAVVRLKISGVTRSVVKC